MNIINYSPYNHYTNRVALVVDWTAERNIMVGVAPWTGNNSEVDSYLLAMKSMQMNNSELSSSDYYLFTIDLLGYHDLYVQADEVWRPVFAQWEELLQYLLHNEMRSRFEDEHSHLQVMSHQTCSSQETIINRYLSISKMLGEFDCSINRLVNIAIPKTFAINGFCAKRPTLTNLDGVYQLTTIRDFPQLEYDCHHFKYAEVCQGQTVTFIKPDDADRDVLVDIVLHDHQHFCDKVICDNQSIFNLTKFIDHVQFSENDTEYILTFTYSPDHNYEVRANYANKQTGCITPATIQVRHPMMLRHALAAGLIFDDYNIKQRPDGAMPETMTLPEVYTKRYCYELDIQDWRSDPYFYDYHVIHGALAQDESFYERCEGNLTAGTYLYEPLQTSSKHRFYLDKFAAWFVNFQYGNLHTFLLASTDAPQAYWRPMHNAFRTACDLTNLDMALSSCILPIIHDNKVMFRNIVYTFTENVRGLESLEGKRFALVVRHTEGASRDPFYSAEILQSSRYVAVVLNISLHKVFHWTEKSRPADLTIDDFYRTDFEELLPAKIQAYLQTLNGEYSIAADISCQSIDIDLPVL